MISLTPHIENGQVSGRKIPDTAWHAIVGARWRSLAPWNTYRGRDVTRIAAGDSLRAKNALSGTGHLKRKIYERESNVNIPDYPKVLYVAEVADVAICCRGGNVMCCKSSSTLMLNLFLNPSDVRNEAQGFVHRGSMHDKTDSG